MPKQTIDTLLDTAAGMLTAAGFVNVRTWQEGSEVACLIFNDQQGLPYTLTWGGEDNFVDDVSVEIGDYERYDSYDEEDDEHDWPADDLGVTTEPRPLWKLEIPSGNFYLPESTTEGEGYYHDLRITVADTVFMLGALACFLHDFKEGNVHA